jgi:oligoendopeptidase F
VKSDLQEIMNQLLSIRVKKAKNSNLPNYRDYMFKKYERFDYTPEDCKQLAYSIRSHVLPLAKQIQEQKKKELNLEELRPYDTKGVPSSRRPLKPFNSIEELIEKTSTVLGEIDPRFGELIKEMDERGMLDLKIGEINLLEDFVRHYLFPNYLSYL